MLETLILLALAALLGLYAVHEPAPARWAAGLWKLRRLAVTSPPPSQGAVREREAVMRDVPSAGAGMSVTQPAAPSSRQAMVAVIMWAAVAIVALAFVLRVIQLTDVPYGFFCDEASPALDAYLIAHTLHDQHGAFLPAYLQALGEWPGGFQTYWDVPFVLIFGLTEFASRFAAVVAGTLTVWLTYLFVSKATNRPVGLITAFLLATSPWHIMQSREGWQVINLPLITALCLLYLYLGLERPRWLALGFVCGAMGMYGYFPLRIFLPLLYAAWMLIYVRHLLRHWRMAALGVGAALVILIPTALALANGTVFARLNQFGGPPQTLGQQVATYWTNYLAHFSAGFLFNTTDFILRHFVRGFSLLYPIEAPFLVIGILAMLWRRRPFDLLCLAWLVIYPLSGALVGPPIVTRAIPGLIVLQIAAAQGIYVILQGIHWLASRLPAFHPYRAAVIPAVSGLLLLIGLGATATFMHAYLVDYPRYSSGWWGWQWGAQPIVAYFEAHSAGYDREYMNADLNAGFNAPDELLRFYTTPQGGRCAACGITTISDPKVVQAQYVPQQRELWAVSPSALDGSVLRLLPHRVVSHISYPDGSPAFLFVATGPGIVNIARRTGPPSPRRSGRTPTPDARAAEPHRGSGLAAPPTHSAHIHLYPAWGRAPHADPDASRARPAAEDVFPGRLRPPGPRGDGRATPGMLGGRWFLAPLAGVAGTT
jgi:4-amino-4-deoxy-L-arabinose transferase-like glycosyltransferase